MDEMAVIGKPLPRKDGLEKILGRAQYCGDMMFHRMLHAKVVRSPISHGRIKRVDLSGALHLPGVVAGIKADDFPGDIHFGPTGDQQVLADRKVRYVGDDVAVIAAETQDLATQAVSLVQVEYENLPSILRPEESLKKESVLIHDRGNIGNTFILRKGSVQEGFKKAHRVLEREYQTSSNEHAYLEPEAIVAVPDHATDAVILYAPVQNPFVLRETVAKALQMKQNRIRVIQATTGGAFGGKNDNIYKIGAQAALLSLRTGRPVRITYSREETFVASYKSPPFKMHYKIGAQKDGKIVAVQVEYLVDLGAYNPYSKRYVSRSGVQSAGPYEVEHVEVEGKAVYTNKVYTGAFRSFGGYQIAFGIETLIDELAGELNIDPLELRVRNVLKKGSRTITGQVMEEDPSFIEILKRLREKSGWDGKKAPSSQKQKRRGLGVALGFYGLSLGYLTPADISQAGISVNEDGSIVVSSVYTDCGAGAKTALCQIAAEALGASYDSIQYLEPDTSRVVDCGPLVGSRSVLCGGNAVMDAARKLKAKILQVASDLMEANPESLTVKENHIFVYGSPAKYIEIRDVAKECGKRGVILKEDGLFQAPSLECDPKTGQGSPYFAYSPGGHVAEVEVDSLSGAVRIVNYVAVHNAGKVINLTGITGQIEGAVAMGVGCALLEKFYPKEETTPCKNFGEYEIPTSLDIPPIDISLVENPFSAGPYGAIGIAEPAIVPVAPAVINAVSRATGKRLRHFPVLPEDILKDGL